MRARVLLTVGGHVPDRSGLQARAAGEEALALAQEIGDPTTLANALCHLALNRAGHDPADNATALELLARARAAAAQAGGYQPRLEVAVTESHILEGMGRHEDAAPRWRRLASPERGTRACPGRPGRCWRSTWPSRWCRWAAGTRRPR